MCLRDEQLNHPYHKNSSRNWEIEDVVKFSNADEFEDVAKCGKHQCSRNILGNYVTNVDICTQVYYFFIDTIWNFEDKFRYPNYVAKSIGIFFRANLMLLELLYNYHGV
jgi:hypothetical protein